MNKEVNVVEPVPEEEQSPVEVEFDICGLTPNQKFPSTKASPGCI
jgi:hypothetical protein